MADEKWKMNFRGANIYAEQRETLFHQCHVGNDASLGTRFDLTTAVHLNPTFGQSFTNAARSPWGIAGSSFGATYYPGGARSLKVSMKFEF